LEMAGVRFTGFYTDSAVVDPFESCEDDIKSFELDPDVRAVVSALDPFVNYTKIFKLLTWPTLMWNF